MRHLIRVCLKLSGITWTPQPHMSLLTVIPVHFRGEQEADMTRVCTGTITCAGKCSGGLTDFTFLRG